MGAYRVIDLEQFPVQISKDEAPTPQTDNIWDFVFPRLSSSSSVTHLSFFLSLYSLVRFMAFQSVLVGTTPAFTIIINTER